MNVIVNTKDVKIIKSMLPYLTANLGLILIDQFQGLLSLFEHPLVVLVIPNIKEYLSGMDLHILRCV